MFEYDLSDARQFQFKTDKRAAFAQYLLTLGMSEDEYPFSFKGKALYKGKPCVFTISGWGGYYNANGEWVVFIAYRCEHPKHTIQHCWSWDGENNTVFNYRKMEFMN
ncbi:MAG TPA: hypothetical protein VKH37_07325 [Ferruginibacter sp.]|nr:hypothetical protein [Ferruginibacter sp.]